jgi:hypothetical protein
MGYRASFHPILIGLKAYHPYDTMMGDLSFKAIAGRAYAGSAMG